MASRSVRAAANATPRAIAQMKREDLTANGIDMPPAPTPQVFEKVEDLEATVTTLETGLMALASRLAPVSRTYDGDAGAQGRPVHSVPLVERLASVTDRLVAVNGLVADATNALEI